MIRVEQRPSESRDPNRRERGRRRRPLLEPFDEHEQGDDHDPAADAEERAEEAGHHADQDEPHPANILGAVASGLLDRLREAPERAGILLDVDGVLAPIVARPEDAMVPAETRRELERLRDRYSVVGVVSGRTSDDAERIVGVAGLVYLGSHGLELAPDAKHWQDTIHEFAAGVDWPVEDKGLTVSFHYRLAPDQRAARAELEEVASRARAAGLKARFGRKVLELLPPITANKGTAVKSLLEERGLQRALYAGDDTTDLDGFAAVAELELGVRVAVASPEGPSTLRDAADVVVASPADLLDLLRQL